MLDKLLREVVGIVIGKQAELIADSLHSKKHVNEFSIAKKLDVTINQTRNMLYKLSDYGLVSSIRKKDKKKGWYTYYWKIEVHKALDFLKENIEKRKMQVENQIKSRETKVFYVCERCNIEYTEENALLYNFTCRECEGIFVLKDNTQIIKELKKNLERMDKKLEAIEIEREKEQKVLDKIKERELKKQQKEKERKAAERRAKRAATMKKKAPSKKKATKEKKTTKKTAKKTTKKATTKKAIKKPKKPAIKTKKKVPKKTPSKKKSVTKKITKTKRAKK